MKQTKDTAEKLVRDLVRRSIYCLTWEGPEYYLDPTKETELIIRARRYLRDKKKGKS